VVEVDDPVAALRNTDVEWDGTTLGLVPTVTSPGAQRLLRYGTASAHRLVAALSDPDRFVAAHVILTLVSGVAHDTYPDWNGLTVDIGADGRVGIDPDQRFALVRRWRRWLQTA
jgi:hypothetical protein